MAVTRSVTFSIVWGVAAKRDAPYNLLDCAAGGKDEGVSWGGFGRVYGYCVFGWGKGGGQEGRLRPRGVRERAFRSVARHWERGLRGSRMDQATKGRQHRNRRRFRLQRIWLVEERWSMAMAGERVLGQGGQSEPW